MQECAGASAIDPRWGDGTGAYCFPAAGFLIKETVCLLRVACNGFFPSSKGITPCYAMFAMLCVALLCFVLLISPYAITHCYRQFLHDISLSKTIFYFSLIVTLLLNEVES